MGIQKTCILTGVVFTSKHPDDVISPMVRELILKLVKQDKKFQEEIVKEAIPAIVNNGNLVRELAREVFSVPCASIGLNVPGTIADYFCKNWKTEV